MNVSNAAAIRPLTDVARRGSGPESLEECVKEFLLKALKPVPGALARELMVFCTGRQDIVHSVKSVFTAEHAEGA